MYGSCKKHPYTYNEPGYRRFPLIRIIRVYRNSGAYKNMRTLCLKNAREITEQVYDANGNESKLTYELRAIINHHGEAVSMGHYTCYAKR